MALDSIIRDKISVPLESILTHSLEMKVPKDVDGYAVTFMEELGVNVVYMCETGDQPKGIPFQILPGTGMGVYALETGVSPNPRHEVYRLGFRNTIN